MKIVNCQTVTYKLRVPADESKLLNGPDNVIDCNADMTATCEFELRAVRTESEIGSLENSLCFFQEFQKTLPPIGSQNDTSQYSHLLLLSVV